MGKELLGLCQLHDDTLVDNGDAVADESHNRQVVGDEQIGQAAFLLQTAQQIQRQLNEAGYTEVESADSFEEAVNMCRSNAVAGGNVLLSPACASFDMFRDYEERGRIFKELVNALQ